jgi:hypothetical protein
MGSMGTSRNCFGAPVVSGEKGKEPDTGPRPFVLRVPISVPTFAASQPVTIRTEYVVFWSSLRTLMSTVELSQVAVPKDAVPKLQVVAPRWKVRKPVAGIAAEAVPPVSAKAAAMIVMNKTNRFIAFPPSSRMETLGLAASLHPLSRGCQCSIPRREGRSRLVRHERGDRRIAEGLRGARRSVASARRTGERSTPAVRRLRGRFLAWESSRTREQRHRESSRGVRSGAPGRRRHPGDASER